MLLPPATTDSTPPPPPSLCSLWLYFHTQCYLFQPPPSCTPSPPLSLPLLQAKTFNIVHSLPSCASSSSLLFIYNPASLQPCASLLLLLLLYLPPSHSSLSYSAAFFPSSPSAAFIPPLLLSPISPSTFSSLPPLSNHIRWYQSALPSDEQHENILLTSLMKQTRLIDTSSPHEAGRRCCKKNVRYTFLKRSESRGVTSVPSCFAAAPVFLSTLMFLCGLQMTERGYLQDFSWLRPDCCFSFGFSFWVLGFWNVGLTKEAIWEIVTIIFFYNFWYFIDLMTKMISGSPH